MNRLLSHLSRRRVFSVLAAAAGMLAIPAAISGTVPAQAAEDDPAAARERAEREHRWHRERQERSRELQEMFQQDRLRRERRDAEQDRRSRDYEERLRSLSPGADE